MPPFLRGSPIWQWLRRLLPFCGCVLTAAAALPADHARGQELFAQHCASCHALSLDAMAPPLGGITSLLPRDRLLDWIRDPAKVIASGDARANALLARYKVPMPPFPHLAETELNSILNYIEHESAAQKLKPFVLDVGASSTPAARLAPPVQKTDLVVELDDVVAIPRLPGRTPYKGITLLRADPRESGALFVDELMGILYRVRHGEVSVFLDVRPYFDEFLCDPGVASGLGSFALHPEFVRNGIFYTIHSERFRGSPAINANPPGLPPSELPPLEWILTEWRLTDPAAREFAGTHRDVLRFVTPTTAHNAQEIAFAPVADRNDPDYGLLYVCIGDGGSANLKRPDIAGHPRSLLGTILRIDPAGTNGPNGRYGIPADNPFAGAKDPQIRQEIWAYGFRNPHRISWDVAHGRRMFSVDIGEANIEEVNLIEKGGAYGWAAGGLEGTTRIDPTIDAKIVRPATPAEMAGTHPPFAQYDHVEGTAVTGGYVYRGPIELLRGKYIFGDIVNGRLFYVHADADLSDRTIYELNLVRDGAVTSMKTLARAARAHLRFSYDDRTGDLYLLTKDDGMIRRVRNAYRRAAPPLSSSHHE